MTKEVESIAMLTALWTTNHSDVIDLLIPFAKYAIFKTTKINENIKFSKVQEIINSEIAYSELPMHVVEKLVNRLVHQGIVELTGNKNYVLRLPLDDDANNYESIKLQQKEVQNRLGDKLAAYLNRSLQGKVYDEFSAIDALVDFFESQGLTIARKTHALELIRKRDSKIQYLIAQFIYQEFDLQSPSFTYIEDMLKGYFISSAIFFSANSLENIEKTKFSKTTVYLDTALLLNLLKLQDDYQITATVEFVNMLKKQNARIACFSMTINEVRGIIAAYKRDLINGRVLYRQGGPTLQGWDKIGITPEQIEIFDIGLEERIRKLGIEIVDKPPVGRYEEYPVDEKGLQEKLQARIRYPKYRDSSLLHDVDCITSICLLRGDLKPKKIEECGHIFVTPNPLLVKEANDFLNGGNNSFIAPLSYENELAAILWLKSFSNFGDYPKRKLIEHAVLALEPDEELICKFYDCVDNLDPGTVSEEEIAAIRSGLIQHREVMALANGDIESVGTETVLQARELLKRKYDAEHIEALNLERAITEDVRRKVDSINKKAASAVNACWNEEYAKRYRRLRLVTSFLLASFGVAFLLAFIVSFSSSFAVSGIAAAVLFCLDIATMITFLLEKHEYLDNKIKRFARDYADKVADKKRDEYEAIIIDETKANTV